MNPLHGTKLITRFHIKRDISDTFSYIFHTPLFLITRFI